MHNSFMKLLNLKSDSFPVPLKSQTNITHTHTQQLYVCQHPAKIWLSPLVTSIDALKVLLVANMFISAEFYIHICREAVFVSI